MSFRMLALPRCGADYSLIQAVSYHDAPLLSRKSGLFAEERCSVTIDVRLEGKEKGERVC